MAIIVAFISQKDGIDKSTLARTLTRELANNKLSVKIIALDTQKGTFVE